MSRAFIGLILLLAVMFTPSWLAPPVALQTPDAPQPTAPASSAVTPSPPPEVVEGALPLTTARLEALARDTGFNGAVLVARGDRVLLRRAFGEADHETGAPLTPRTRFRIASVSKQFTAAAILRLQDQGVLSVEDRLCRWIDPCPEAWAPITLHQLLAHTSGVSDITARPGWLARRRIPSTPAQLQAESAALPLDFPPGSRFRYSNAGYNLLGDVVAAATGRPFHDVLRTEFFEPLGMTDTGFDEGETGTAMGYAWLPERTPQPVSNASLVYAAGGLYSTLEDLRRWNRALHGGTLLSEAAYSRMITPHAAPVRRPGSRFEPTRFGYGLMRSELGMRMTPSFGVEQIYHTGSWAGFRALVVHDPARDVTAIAWTNHYPRRNDLFLITQWAVAELADAPLPDAIAD